MDYEVDARGLAYPLPVMRTSKVLADIDKGRVIVVVDNTAATKNLYYAFIGG